jgi:hypothetical protein
MTPTNYLITGANQMSNNKPLEIKITDNGEHVGNVFLSMYENKTRTFITYPKELIFPEVVLSEGEGNNVTFKTTKIKHQYYGSGTIGENNVTLTIERTKNDKSRLAIYVVRA